MGRDQGITEDQIHGLADYATSDAFTKLERDVLAYATSLTRTPADATDEQVAALRTQLSDEQLVELTAMIGWENFRARFNRGFDVQEQGFSEGGACAIPERHPARAGE